MTWLRQSDLRTVSTGRASGPEDCEPLVGGFAAAPAPAAAPRWWWAHAAIAVLGVPLLLAAAVAAARLHLRRPHGFTSIEMSRKDIEVAGGLLPCSEPGRNCTSARCCSISGFKCFEKNAMFAGCLPSCPPAGGGAWSCARPARLRKTKPSLGRAGGRLFCFVVIAFSKGAQEQNWELSLVRTQLRMGTSIFACEDWMVFSDESTWLSPGPPVKLSTFKVIAPHTIRRPSDGEWLNTPTFQNVWRAIREEGRWARNDWAVKVDPDTVFLPSRLRPKLAGREVTAGGIYLTNCRGVTYGFFGALEVMSKVAFATLLNHVEDCSAALAWNQSGAEWSEDLFAQRCMDLHGVDNVEDFSLLRDSTCEGIANGGRTGAVSSPQQPSCSLPVPALHAFGTPREYFACLEATQLANPDPDAATTTTGVQAHGPPLRMDDWLRSARRAVRQMVEGINAQGFGIAPRLFALRMDPSDGAMVRLPLGSAAGGALSCNASVVANATSELLGAESLQIDRLDPHDLQCHSPTMCEFTFNMEASARTLQSRGSGTAQAMCDTGHSVFQQLAVVNISKSLGSFNISTTDLKATANLQSGRILEFIIKSLEFRVIGGEPENCQAGALQDACGRLSLLLRERVHQVAEGPAFKEVVASALRQGLNMLLPLRIRARGGPRA